MQFVSVDHTVSTLGEGLEPPTTGVTARHPHQGGLPSTESPTGVSKQEVFATYVGNVESWSDSEGPDGIRTRYRSVKSRLPVRIGSRPTDWRNRIRTCGLTDVSGASTPTGLSAIAGPRVELGPRGYEPRGLPLPHPAAGHEGNLAAGRCSSPDLNRGLDRERVVSLAATPLERWPRPKGIGQGGGQDSNLRGLITSETKDLSPSHQSLDENSMRA